MLVTLSFCKLAKHQILTSTMETKLRKLLLLEQKLARAELALEKVVAEVKSIREELDIAKASDAKEPAAGIPAKGSTLANLGPLTQKRLLHNSTNVELLEKIKRAKMSFDKIGDYVVVYTDGACPNNGKNGARAGIGVWFGENHPLNVGKPCPGNRQTNNAAEILACAEACKVAAENDIGKLQINTDSKFVIDCVTKWMANWKKNNWKNAAGKDVINKDELLVLEKCSKVLQDVKYNHVNGHVGIVGNEGADRLAVQGANY